MRFTISLPDVVTRSLNEDVKATDIPRSTLIAHYIAEHYERASVPELEEQIFKLKRQHEDEMTYTKTAYDKQLETLQQNFAAAEQQAEMKIDELTEQFRQEQEKLEQTETSQLTEIGKMLEGAKKLDARIKQVEQELADKEDSLQALGQEKFALMEHAEEEIADKNVHIEKLERGMQELLKQVETERASKQAVAAGLQHELELLKTTVKNLEEQLVVQKEVVQSLERDKEYLQNELEIVTLRLPSPNAGFWSRVFGGNRAGKD